MKIIFNLLATGAGNNGGTLTLFRSANALVDLGHDVLIIDSDKNYHTWTNLKCQHLKIETLEEIPDSDAVIATGIKSVKSTGRIKNTKLKFHWIRGWELWKIEEPKLVNILKNSDTIKIVNSICLQDKLKKFEMESDIIRPGYDFNEIFPLNIRKNNKKITIGALYSHGTKRAGKRVNLIFEIMEKIKSKHKNVKFIMYGSEGIPSNNLIDEFFKEPNIGIKNRLYNLCDIWIATSNLEGLHIPPAEAMITECPVVGTNAEMAGTQDYLIDNVTGFSCDDVDFFVKKIEDLILNDELRSSMGKNGREKILEIGDRHKNMKKLIDLIESRIT